MEDKNDFKTKVKSKFNTSNIILFVVILLLMLFTLRVLDIVETTGYEPSSLIVAVFGAGLGEFGIMGWIKSTKIKNQNDINNSEEGVG